MLLFVFEFLGTTELLVIALVALIIFGPRKLPEIGRTIGRSLAEFKRASEDFKRTWEYEVEMERRPAADAPAAPQTTPEAGERLLEEGAQSETVAGPGIVVPAEAEEEWQRTVARGAHPADAEAAETLSDAPQAAVSSTAAVPDDARLGTEDERV